MNDPSKSSSPDVDPDAPYPPRWHAMYAAVSFAQEASAYDAISDAQEVIDALSERLGKIEIAAESEGAAVVLMSHARALREAEKRVATAYADVRQIFGGPVGALKIEMDATVEAVSRERSACVRAVDEFNAREAAAAREAERQAAAAAKAEREAAMKAAVDLAEQARKANDPEVREALETSAASAATKAQAVGLDSPVSTKAPAKIKGVTTRTRWIGEVGDPVAFLRWLLEHRPGLVDTVIGWRQAGLNTIANEIKSTQPVPGFLAKKISKSHATGR